MKESTNSSITANFLKSLDPKVKDEILTNIAKHYGISNQEAFEEVTDDDAESIMDYVTGSIRSTVSLLFNKFKGTMKESRKPIRLHKLSESPTNGNIDVKIKKENGTYWLFLQQVDGEEKNITNVGFETIELARHSARMKAFNIVSDPTDKQHDSFNERPESMIPEKPTKREKTPGTETPKVMDLGKEKVTKLEEMLKRIIKEEIGLLKEEPSTSPNKFIQYIENASLYGWDNVLDVLKDAGFDLLSYRKSSVPTEGSPTIDLKRKLPKFNDTVTVESVKVDKNGNIIVRTNVAYMIFWKNNMKESWVKKKSVPKV